MNGQILFMLYACCMMLLNVRNGENNDSSFENKDPKTYESWTSPAPYFKVKDYHGGNISLDNLRGEWILLYFWTTKSEWSSYGLEEIEKLAAKYEHMETVCLCCYETDKDWADVVKNRRTISNLRHVFLKEKSKVSKDYHIRVFPTLILINPEGNIIDFHEGFFDSIHIDSLDTQIYQ